MVAAGQIEAIGIPADKDQISRLSKNWHAIRDHVVKTVDHSHGVYKDGYFSVSAFAHWLADEKIDWPRLHSGLLDLKDDTFREMTRAESDAQELLRLHRAAFPKFWSWLDNVESSALLAKMQQSVFGWGLAIGDSSNPRAIRNFPMQSNGAEMLRLACCLAIENGIRVCAPDHDALLIEAPTRELDKAIHLIQRLMAEASAVVLDGFALRTSVRSVRFPGRWTDPRGTTVWSAVERALLQEQPRSPSTRDLLTDELPVHLLMSSKERCNRCRRLNLSDFACCRKVGVLSTSDE